MLQHELDRDSDSSRVAKVFTVRSRKTSVSHVWIPGRSTTDGDSGNTAGRAAT